MRSGSAARFPCDVCSTFLPAFECSALVDGGAPFVYAYYPGVDEVAHAHGLQGAYYPAELAAADALVGALLDALPSRAALLVTADHGQVHLGAESWIGLGALDSMVETYAGGAHCCTELVLFGLGQRLERLGRIDGGNYPVRFRKRPDGPGLG